MCPLLLKLYFFGLMLGIVMQSFLSLHVATSPAATVLQRFWETLNAHMGRQCVFPVTFFFCSPATAYAHVRPRTRECSS